MSYLEFLPTVDTPPDCTVLWRYMDLPKLLAVLENRSLYFALPSEFEDKWEAVVPRDLTTAIQTSFVTASGAVLDEFRRFHGRSAINCWYCGPDESVAMWRLYTTSEYGVAITTTVGRLKLALEHCERDVYLGSVRYQDHTEKPAASLSHVDISPMRPLLQKRVCYKHESELRAITLLPDNPIEASIANVVRIPAATEHGESLSVNLESLIERVVTGPRYPFWALSLLEIALARSGLQIPVTESNVFKAPERHFIDP